MKNKIQLFSFLIISFVYIQAQPTLPRIEEYNGINQLIIKKSPYIMLSGELHNSSSSCLEYMQPIWGRLKQMNLNTIIASVSWELFEPVEGKFDYTLVEGLIKGARKNNFKLVLIWFATWKNGEGTYVPAWVKKDQVRFPRMQPSPGRSSRAMSIWGSQVIEADARAYAELMRYIKKIDATEQTVLMMQVENEIGVLGTARDMSPLAQQAFAQQVPQELLNSLNQQKDDLTDELRSMMAHIGSRTSGTWLEMFGYGADEVFMAWHIARCIETIVQAGKQIYPLPMFVNAWLDPSYSRDISPNYPSGGPVSKMINVWRAGAPSVDLYAPDIYLDNFKRASGQYVIAGNPLFIPETNPDIRSAANIYYALGQHNAICYAPFAIDGLPESVAKSIGESYGSLAGFLPFWAKHSGKGKNVGFTYTNAERESLTLGDYRIDVSYSQKRDTENSIPESCGLILQVTPDEFFVTGRNIRVSFSAYSGRSETISIDDGVFVNGVWKPGRRLNGDEFNIRIGNKPEFRRIILHKL